MSSIVLTEQELAKIRAHLDKYGWYRDILKKFQDGVDELIRRQPDIPLVKGRAFFESCPVDNARLVFDPYRPESHICPKCGRNWTDEEYYLAWVRQFQEWLQKRTVEAGVLYRVLGEERYAEWTARVLRHFVQHYEDYPLANNLLGPTRLFQSTYAEAFWLADMVTAYDLVRNAPCFSEEDHEAVKCLFYKSCDIIRSFDERISNRQAFNNVGMGAVGLLYDDDELIQHVLDGPSGFSFHMRNSLLEDGIWYEGENYHFATLDHLLNLAEMARHRGIDLYNGESGYGSLKPMFYGPLKVMYPDLTFPSRKDGWFGRGIEYYKEIYELGYARYRDERLGGLLARAYGQGMGRRDLTWRAFLYLEPDFPDLPGEKLRPRESERMPGTGVAVLRREEGSVYASVEYGHYGGGHGHPDRLHMSFFDQDVLWFTDPGTGWYHTADLAWYRSSLAHNTVVVDGNSQAPAEGSLTAFGETSRASVVQSVISNAYPGVSLTRTICLTEDYLLDVFDVISEQEHTYDWVLHTRASLNGQESGVPEAGDIGDRNGYEFLKEVKRHGISSPDFFLTSGTANLRVVQLGQSEVYTAVAPGIPLHEEVPFNTIIARRHSQCTRYITCIFCGQTDSVSLEEKSGLIFIKGTEGEHCWQVNEGQGAGMVVTEKGRWKEAAWFGCSGLDTPFVSIVGDRTLKQARVARDKTGYRFEVPTDFGEISITGEDVSESTPISLPEGAEVLQRSGGLTVRQKPGVAIWAEPERAVLFAGCRNRFRIMVGRYGIPAQTPEVILPDGWICESIQSADSRGMIWECIILPSTDGPCCESIRVRCGEERVFPVRVEAPVIPHWDVVSEGGPSLKLTLRDRTQTGGVIAGSIYASWSDKPFRFEAQFRDGRAVVNLPLPLEPVEPGILKTPWDSNSSHLWVLDGADNTAGLYQVAAVVDYQGFRGCSCARLPIYWSVGRKEDCQEVLRLNRAEQAYWAEFPYRGEADCEATASIQWDDRGLYLTCDVRDDIHVSDANKDDLYENDSIQFYLDFRRGRRRERDFTPGIAAYILAPNESRTQVRIRAIAGNREISNRSAKAGWFGVEGVAAKCIPTDEGYRIEAFFPYESLGVEAPRLGDVVGMDLALSDNDGTWYRKLQLMWSGARGRRCYIRGSYHNPGEFGYMVFGRAAGGDAR